MEPVTINRIQGLLLAFAGISAVTGLASKASLSADPTFSAFIQLGYFINNFNEANVVVCIYWVSQIIFFVSIVFSIFLEFWKRKM
jgi:hypothetical protein